MRKHGFFIYRYYLRLLEFIICILSLFFIYKYVRSLWCLESLFSSIFFVSSCIFINPEIYWSPFICVHLCVFLIPPEKFFSSISSSILFMFFYFFSNSYGFFIYLCNNSVSLWAFGVSHFGGERTLRNVIFYCQTSQTWSQEDTATRNVHVGCIISIRGCRLWYPVWSL